MARMVVVDSAIFGTCPHFFRGIVLATNIRNAGDDPSLRDKLMRASLELLHRDVLAEPRIQAWERAYRDFRLNPNKHPPAVKALAKRASSRGELPFINSVVAMMNLISLSYLVPCGGDDIEATPGELRLALSTGAESFSPLGQPGQREAPDPGEVIYFSTGNNEVMCRRWNWRNSDVTKIQINTRSALINVDCLPPVTVAEACHARDELAALLEEHCHAEVTVHAIDYSHPRLALDF